VNKNRPARKGPHASFEHLQPLARLSLLGAATSGLLLVLTFPKFNLLPLAAVALLPLLLTAAKEPSAKRRLLGGYLAGLVFFAGTCYWIYNVQHDYGGLSVAEAAGVFALFCAVLAVYTAVFSWLAGYLWNLSWGPAAIPLLWVGLEYARTYLITGFPWLLLGYALTDNFPLARLARWTGVYGLSYLLVALTVASIWLLVRPGSLATLHLLAVVGLFCGLSGVMQFSRLTVGDPTVAVGLELDIIASVVIGGGSLNGGQGSILGSMIGVFIMAFLRNGCTMMGWPNYIQEIIIGLIIIVAVALDQLRYRRDS